MKSKLLGITAFLFFVALACYASQQPETMIRIGILQKVKSFNLSCDEKYYIAEASTNQKAYLESSNSYLLKGSKAGIIIGEKVYKPPLRVGCDKAGVLFKINGRRYRDGITVLCKDSKLTVINDLDLESYLLGTVSKEVNPDWQAEALKAQAVVSRTYAIKSTGKHSGEGFDLCNETHCQVYGGVEAEDPRTSSAVEATRSMVLAYKGELCQTYYHAACGGYTENPGNVWDYGEEIPPYLKGVADKFCKGNPHSSWKIEIPEEKIRKKLIEAGYETGKIKNITIVKKGRSGRAEKLNIMNYKGNYIIGSNKFRLAVDAWVLQSTFFSKITRKGDKFVFEGKGWGHGVGMCQWGAKGMADKGYEYRKILTFYYPGTEVQRWNH